MTKLKLSKCERDNMKIIGHSKKGRYTNWITPTKKQVITKNPKRIVAIWKESNKLILDEFPKEFFEQCK